MVALYPSDRQAEAFDAFRAWCALSREQLGVDLAAGQGDFGLA
ncbi:MULTISPECIES: BTAD domain-containing putative transcriptional regulator [unclassified Embleya]